MENGNSGFKITMSSYVRLKVCLALPLSWFLKIYPLGLLFHVTYLICLRFSAALYLNTVFWMVKRICSNMSKIWLFPTFTCPETEVLRNFLYADWRMVLQHYNILHFMGLLRPKAEHSVPFQVMHLILNWYFCPVLWISAETQLKKRKLSSKFCHWHSM